MLGRSLLLCSCLLFAVALAQDASPKFRGSAASASASSTASTPTQDAIIEDLEALKIKYANLRDEVNNWLNDPFHRNVVMPSIIGAVSGIATMCILYCLICCVRKRCCRRNKNNVWSRLSHEEKMDGRTLPSKNN